jgi:hypothetical protein
MRPGDRMAGGMFAEDAALDPQDMMQRMYGQQPAGAAPPHQDYSLSQAGGYPPAGGGFSGYPAPQYQPPPHYAEPGYVEPPSKYHPPYYQDAPPQPEPYHSNSYSAYPPAAPYPAPPSQLAHHAPPHYSQPPEYHDPYRQQYHGGGRAHPPPEYGTPQYRPEYAPPRYDAAPGYEYQGGHEYYGYNKPEPAHYSSGQGYAPGRVDASSAPRFPATYDPYSHDLTRRGGPGLAYERTDGILKRPGDEKEKRPGDWSCPKCGFHCFASKNTCRQCGEHKPASAYLPSPSAPGTSLLNADGSWAGLEGGIPAGGDATHTGQKRGEECKYFNMRGGCKRGEQCHFAHVIARPRCALPSFYPL